VLTRVRVEASDIDRQELLDELLTFCQVIRDSEGGQWMIEDDDVHIIPSHEGYWGRMTIRRTTHASERISAGSDPAGNGKNR
jgi:hypothetical protein